MPADLHLHTKASDGTDSIKTRIKDAKQKNLDIIAITDHDTLNNNLKDRKTMRKQVKIITGIELKSFIQKTRIEVLGYFIDPSNKHINRLLNKQKEKRVERMKKFTENLKQHYNLNIKFKTVKKHADNSIGRPHLAKALKEENIVKTEEEAFQKYIGRESKAYIPSPKLEAEKAINTIHKTGGVTSLAHPGRDLEKNKAEEKIRKLKNKGLDAIETKYTYQHKRKNTSISINFGKKYSKKLREKYNLLETGGTDCHGKKSEKYLLGKIKLKNKKVEKLEQKSKKYR